GLARGDRRARRGARSALHARGRRPTGAPCPRGASPHARSCRPVVRRVPLRTLDGGAAPAVRAHAVLRPLAGERTAAGSVALRRTRPDGRDVPGTSAAADATT